MKAFKILGWAALCIGFVASSSCSKRGGPTAPKEKVFRLALVGKIPGLDPQQTTDLYSAQVQGLVYESLYEYKYQQRPLELEPNLAESMPIVSRDKKTITFKIKRGVLYHDNSCFQETGGKGREVIAEDFVYAIHRMAAPKSMSPYYSSLEGRIVGIEDYHSGKTTSIQGVRALDAVTFQVQLTKPNPRFVYNFISHSGAPLPKECVERLGDKINTQTVGTGPFILREFNPGGKSVAVRNEHYRGASQGVPYLDKVSYEVITEAQPMWLKFLSGELEISGVPKDSVQTAIPNGELSPELMRRGVKHFRAVRGDVTTFIFNMEDPVWGKRKELRQAFALAFDRARMIDLIYSKQAVPAHSLIDPTQYGYDPNWKSQWATRDVARAKALIAAAGYPDGKGLPPLEFPCSADTTSRQISELLQRQLGEAGITLKPMPMTWPEMMSSLQKKKFGVTAIGLSSDVPDPDGAFAQAHSRNVTPGPNYANYRNAKFDQLVDEIEMLENGPERLKKIVEARGILDEDLPYVPGVHRIANQLTQPWVGNTEYTQDSYYAMWLKYMKVMVQP